MITIYGYPCASRTSRRIQTDTRSDGRTDSEKQFVSFVACLRDKYSTIRPKLFPPDVQLGEALIKFDQSSTRSTSDSLSMKSPDGEEDTQNVILSAAQHEALYTSLTATLI